MLEQLLLDRVAVEAGGRAQSAGNGRPGPATGFHVAAEALDVRACLEEVQPALLARSGEHAQMEVGVARQAAVAGEEPDERGPLDVYQGQFEAPPGSTRSSIRS